MKITSTINRVFVGSNPTIPKKEFRQMVKPLKILFIAFILLFINISNAEEKEIDCLAKNIYYEARNQPTSGQFLVGFVTLNRVAHKSWPNNFCEVITQPGEFSWYTKDLMGKTPKETEAYKLAYIIAFTVYNSNYRSMSHYGYFFKRSDVKSTYFNNLKLINVVGDHSFYTFRD